MARLIAAAVMLVLAAGAPPVAAESIDDVAQEAGVDAQRLQEALDVQQLTDPRAYLENVSELARPEPVYSPPTGRLGCIAWVESRNDPRATNPRSRAAGLFQFLPSTWATTPQGRSGLSPYDPVAATAAAEWMVSQGRIREWVAVSGGWC